jgi:hypothetical protein
MSTFVVRLNRVLAIAFLAIGVALLVETAALGGGQVGFLAGGVFVLLGVLRWRAMRPTEGRRP